MNIHLELAKIQATLKAPKSQTNAFGKYKYRSCEDILNAVKPLLGEMSLIISDEIIQIGERYYVKATAALFLGDASVSVSAFAREPKDKKGMDDAQITGATSSYARKYALNGLFCIDDTKDADTQDNSDKKQSAKPRVASPNQFSPNPTPKPLTGNPISEAQGRRLYSISNGSGYTQEDVKAHIKDVYGYETASAIDRKHYEEICGRFQVQKGA